MQPEKIGDFLASLRKSKGFTQQEVAEQLHLSNKTISKWESGAGLPDVSVLPALAELYGVSVDDILAGQRLKRDVASHDTPERWDYYMLRSRMKLDIAFLVALTLTLINLLVCAGDAGPFTAWQHPIGILLCLMVMAIGMILATYPLRQVPQACRTQITHRIAVYLLLLVSVDLVSVFSILARYLSLYLGELTVFIYNLHCVAAILMGLLWRLPECKYGPMLTGSRRKVFFAGTVLLFLSDAPADIFFLMMAPGIFSSADQVDRWIALFDKALSWFTFGGLVALTVAVVWQIIAERKPKGKLFLT